MSERTLVALGALFALLAVAAGAFGAHALAARLTPERLATFEVGARYQMYHALALFVTAWAAQRWPASSAGLAGWFFLAGIVVFCGTCYALALGSARWLGAITPIGGVSLMIGWALLAWAALRGAAA